MDGEGCFIITTGARRRPGDISWRCEFRIHLRADDTPMLEMLRDATGLGNVRPGRRIAKTEGRLDKPSSHWLISRRSQCFKFAAILDEYPLWSKKARDFEIWKQALNAWPAQDFARMARLSAQLRSVRAFDGDEFVPIPVSQLELEVA